MVEQWNSVGERWNSDSGQCCGTVEQWNSDGGTVKELWWNSLVEQWKRVGERWNSDSGQCCGTVEQLWWNIVGGTELVEQ